DRTAAGVEVARQQLARRLCIASLGRGGEADEIGEEDGDEAAFRDGRRRGHGRWLRDRLGDRALLERSSAFVAEPHARIARRPAGRADTRQRRPAAAAELRLSAVLSTAVRAA